MDAMDQLFELYNQHIDSLERCAEELNALYPVPAEHNLRRKSRQEFETYVFGPPSQSKRHYILRLVGDRTDLLEKLPSQIRILVRRAA